MSNSKENYAEQLKSPHWQKKRLFIMQRDNFTCQKCGDTETELQVHHKSYEKGKKAWDVEDSQLVCLCKNCHNLIEKLRQDGIKIDWNNLSSVKITSNNDYPTIHFTQNKSSVIVSIFEKDNFILGSIFLKPTIRKLRDIFQNAIDFEKSES